MKQIYPSLYTCLRKQVALIIAGLILILLPTTSARKIYLTLFSVLFLVMGALAQTTTVTINCSGAVGSFNSGYVTSGGVKTDGNLIVDGLTTLRRGWAHFDLSSIPAGSIITGVSLKFTVTSNNAASAVANGIYGFTGTPSAIVGATLYTNTGSGTNFNAAAWTQNTINTLAFNAAGLTFISSNTGTNNCNIGLVRGAGSAIFNIAGYPAAAASQPQLVITYRPSYKSQFVSMNTGASTWCAGTLRNITVTVKNTGTVTWTSALPINIGLKWNEDVDYGAGPTFIPRVSSESGVPSGPVAPGQSVTYTFSNVPGSLNAGNNNLTSDIVKEGDCWFGGNAGSCGPGNSVFTSPVITIVALPATPTGAGAQQFCIINSPTISNLFASGNTIKWYAASTGGTALATSSLLVSGTTYYATQTNAIGCESNGRLAVTATVNNPTTPTGTAAQSFCGINNPTVANLAATGTSIKWYTTSSGGAALAAGTTIIDGSHYYASQTVGICESASRFDVIVTVGNPAAPTGTAAQTFCAVNNPTLADILVTGTAIKWYTAATAGSLLAPTTALVNGTHYYASQTTAGCESATRLDITVTVPNPPAPTGPAAQPFCASSNPTVANLTATGAGIQWYAAATGGTALPVSTLLSNATHYYATQTISGCEGTARLDVTGAVNDPVVIAAQPAATQTICNSYPASFSITATSTIVSYQWYLGATVLTDNINISGAQTNTLQIDQVSAADQGLYHVVITGTAPCTPVTSSDAQLLVNTNIIITTQPVAQTLCLGATATFSVAATGSGLTYKWRKGAGANTATYSDVIDGGNTNGAATTTLIITNISAGDAMNYYVEISDGSAGCPTVNSARVALTVSATSVGGTVGTSTNVCSGTNNGTLILTGQTGNIMNWEFSTDGGTIWTSITNTGSTQTYTNLNATTLYRAVVKSSVCPSDNSVPAAISVNPLPTITPAATAADVCFNASAQTTSLAYSATTNVPTTYSITWDPGPFATISNAALPASPITIAVPAGTAPGTYTGTLTVKSANNCTSSTGINFTVTVIGNSTFALTSVAATANQTICINTGLTNITYAVGGTATGASIKAGALPAGVTFIYNSGVFTISGTPTAAGSFSFTITTAGPCANQSLSGTITVNDNATIALTSAPATTSQTFCINTPITPITYSIGGGGTGATLAGQPAGITGSYNPGTKLFTISGTPTVSGSFSYTLTTTGPCVKPALGGTITVQANSTITLSTPAATSTQTVCINNAITNIVYTIAGGATSANVAGLPPGVNGVLSGNTLTISGTPNTVAGSPFSYTVTATGSCVNASLGGTITVNDDATIALTSPAATISQTLCINTAITPITYQIGGGGTGATISGFPAGVNGSYNPGTKVYTISGTPTASGSFSYTITTTGPCIKPALAGTMNVQANSTITLSSGAGTNNQTVCINVTMTNITFTVGGGGIGATVTGLPTGVNGSYNAGTKIFTINGTPTASGSFAYNVTTTGPCINPSSGGTITVNDDATIALTSAASTTAQTLCINTAITPITYQLGGGATGATLSGFPAGISAAYNSGTKVYTISGTPTVSGSFSYTVTTAGPCVKPALSGSLTVTANSTLTFTSAAGTNAQTICTNTPLVNITYAVGSTGTGATVAGLPTGVTGAYNSGIKVYTISGTPTATGTFNYTVTTTGPCANPSLAGSITTLAAPVGTLTVNETSGNTNNDNIICAGSPVVFTATSGFNAYNFKLNGVSVQSGTSNVWSSSALTNGASVTVDAANGLNCGSTFGPVVITVNPLPSPALVASATTICSGDDVTFTAGGGISYAFKVNGVVKQSSASNTYLTNDLTNGNIITVDVTNANGCKKTSSPITMTANALPSGRLTTSVTNICSGDNITFTAPEGFVSYQFFIDGTSAQGPNTNNIFTSSFASSAVVTIKVSNSNCSAVIDTVAITAQALPSGTLTATENSGSANDNSICSGAPVSFTATSGFTNYNFKVNGLSVQNSASNTYSTSGLGNGNTVTVEASNSFSCKATFNPITITVIATPAGTLTASPASICEGDNVDFTATAGYTNYNFKINGLTVQNGPVNIFSSVSMANGDVVTVQVTNTNSCVAVFNIITLTVSPLPSVTLIPVENSGNTANDGTICTGASITFTAPAAFSNYDFLLNGISVQNSASNTYVDGSLATGDKVEVAVANSNGCVGLSNAVIVTVNTLPAPVNPLTGDLDICVNDTTILSTTTTGGVWSSLDPSIATVDASGAVAGLSGGNATIQYTLTNANGCRQIASAVVAVHALPVVNPITGTLNVCVGSASQLADATTGGVWNSSDNTVATIDGTGLVTGIANGTAVISYIVTNANGCITKATVVFSVNDVPVVSPITIVSPTTTFDVCTGSTINVASVTAGGVWSISGPGGIASINSSGLVTGVSGGTTTISYTVTNGNGCVTTVSAGVNVHALPVPTLIGANPICPNSTEIYTTESGQFNYSWTFTGGTLISGGASTDNFIEITWDQPGTRSIFVNYQNAFGCSGIASATLTTTTGTVPTLAGPSLLCLNNSGTYTTQSGETFYDWIVTGGSITSSGTASDNTATITWTTPGTGTVTINFTDINGCTSANPTIKSVTVNQLPVVVTHNQTVCSPGTANLTSAAVTSGSTGGLTYTYWLDGGAIIPYPTPSTAGAGTYYIKGTITATGCFDIKPVTVTVTTPPSATITYIGSPFCTTLAPMPVIQTGTTGGIYSSAAGLSIDTGNGAIIPSSSTAGTYTVTYTVTAAGGCSVYTTNTSVTITAAPSATISYAGSPFCSSASPKAVTRTGATGGTYSSTSGLTIDPVTGTVTPATSTPGSYSVTYIIAASGGCAQFSTTAGITITAAPSATITYTGSPFCTNTGFVSVSRTGTAGGTFSAAGGLSVNSSTGAITPASSTGGTYTVTYSIAAAGGCALYTTTTSITITNAPAAVAGTSISTCANSGTVNITAGSSAANFGGTTWTSNGTGTLANANSLATATYTPSAADIAAGSRTLTLTVTGNAGCANAVSTKTITINAIPAAFIITPASTSICIDDIQPLTATASTPTTGSATISSGNVNVAIPDAVNLIFFIIPGTATNNMAVATVPAGAVINSMAINFNINHTYDGDLKLNLKAPNGNVLNLINRRGGSGDNFTNTTITSAVGTPVNSGTAPFTTTYTPDATNNTGNPNSNVTAFSSLFGTPNGTWTFGAEDDGAGDAGTIVSWSLTFNYTLPTSPMSVTWSPVAGLYTDPGGTVLYSGQALSTVYAKRSTSGTFSYTATATNGQNCSTSQNVSLTVNPKPVVTITPDYCAVPGKVRLTATSVPAATSYIWSNGATTQSLDIDVAGQFEVTAFGAGSCPGKALINVASELVTNGDFSNGNDGSFTSDYNYKPDIAGNSELIDDSGNNGYSITTNGQNVHTSFWGLDHTNGPGTRNFMAVNGHGNTLVVWKQTIPVQPNTTYYFSAWAMSLNNSGNNAQLQFSVNGTLVGTTASLASGVNSNSNNGWVRFYGTWISGPTTTSTNIYINDLQAALTGNDFGIDDISFGSLSTFITLESALGTDAQTVCVNTAITNIIYNVGNGSPSGPSVTGLPPGVISSFDGGSTLTFSGKPTATGVFTYGISTNGTCNPVTASGTITVQAPTIALSSGSATTNICVGSSASIGYTIGGTATAATVTGLPAGMNGLISGNTYTISGSPTSAAGSYLYTITTTGGACTQVTASGSIVVRSQTVTLNSVAATAAQTVCINTAITTIRYAIGGTANNAAVSGLPTGVSGVYSTGFLTINGSPTSAAGSPYTYTVTTSGPSCTAATITGTITVTPAAAISLSSAGGTDNQSACNGIAVTPISYSVTNASGAAISAGALPAGVTGSFSGGVFTINGTPTAGGTFNYTVTTSGGCATSSVSGTINVQVQTIALSSGVASPSVCANLAMTNIIFSIGGTGTGASATGLPAGVSGAYSGGFFTISGTPTAATGAYSYTVTTSGTCNPVTATGTITIQPTATGGTVASVTICYSGSGTLTLTGQSGSIVRWESSINGGGTWSPIVNTTISQAYTNITVPTLFRAVVGNGCGNVPSTAALVNIRNYWTGTTSSNWNTASNWSGNVVPSTLCAEVYIPGGTLNQPVLNTAPIATITNLHILAGAVLTVSSTGILQIGGTISNAGSFDVTDGSLVFNGSVPQNIAGNLFVGNILKNLTLTNASGLTVSNTAGNFLKITGTVAFGNVNNANFNTGDNIVLTSTAVNTARVADITNGSVNSGNNFIGKVIIERFIPQRRGWRMMTVPVQQGGSQTFNAAWQEGVVNPNYVYANHLDPRPGYGMLITGPTAAVGFDPSPMNNYSVQHFNPLTLAWSGIPNTLSAKVTDSAGYMVFVRGDRSTQIYLNTSAPTSNTILRASGFLKTNLQSVSVPAGIGAYSVVGNPYASTIDLRKVTTSGGVSGVNYVVWDPALTGGSGVGAYQYLTRSGGPGTDYLVFPGNGGPGGGSYGAAFSVNNNIQSSQAFLVQNAGAGSISINENAKIVPTTSAVFRPASPNSNPLSFGYISTLLLYENGSIDSLQLVDGALMMYNENYSNAVDLEDAKKMSNFSSENFAINSNDNWLQIEKKRGIQPTDTIFFKAKSYRLRDYQLKIEAANINQTGLIAFLEDKYLQTSTPVSLEGTTTYRFKVTVDSGAWKPDRFRIVFRNNVVLPVTFSTVKAYRNNDDIHVDWKTEHEMAIANYEVEKSLDGIHFGKAYTEINVVNNDRPSGYRWVDRYPSKGFNFYRVKSIDQNGSAKYSLVVKVWFENGEKYIKLYPNPLVDATFNLYFVNEETGEYWLRLLSSSGELIDAVKINHNTASSKEIFRPKRQPPKGNYILEIIKPDGTKETINSMY